MKQARLDLPVSLVIILMSRSEKPMLKNSIQHVRVATQLKYRPIAQKTKKPLIWH